MDEIRSFADAVRANVERVIVGKRETIDTLLVALLCEGHVLLEDVPGVGKTMLARALAVSLGVDFRRVQCTPDLLPSDITGVSIFNQETRSFQFVPGPAFTHILLADEINRATPRAQSALLEAMGERQVTVDGETRPLRRPFLVLATQNPIEYEGTFPLPEAQLDRFLFKLKLGYLAPSRGERHAGQPRRPPSHRGAWRRWWTAPTCRAWPNRCGRSMSTRRCAPISSTWCKPRVTMPTSPWVPARAARWRSTVPPRPAPPWTAVPMSYPTTSRRLALLALPHRCILRPESTLRGRTPTDIVGEIVAKTPLPLGTVEK